MKTIPLHLQLFTIFQNWAYSDKPDSWWIDFFKKIRATGVKYIEYFPYTVERPGLYNALQPFQKVGDLYDLSKWRKIYWKKLRAFLKLTKKAHIRMIPVVFSKYQEQPFSRSVQRTGGLFGTNSLKWEERFIKKLIRITARTYPGHIWTRLSNEVWHRGNHMTGAIIGQHHEAWYEAIKKWVDLKVVKCDITFSDFVLLTEEHHLLWNGKMPRAANYSGDPSMIRASWGRDEYDRICFAQVHGMPQKLDQVSHGKAWREHIANHSSIRKWDLSTDGCIQGSGYKIKGTPFCNMNEDEITAFAAEVWGYKKKKVIISELPKEVFYRDENGVVADDMSRLDFSRLEAYTEVWEGMK